MQFVQFVCEDNQGHIIFGLLCLYSKQQERELSFVTVSFYLDISPFIR